MFNIKEIDATDPKEFLTYSTIHSHTSYSPEKIVESMGRHWALERNVFSYTLCPRERFSSQNIRQYRKEWEYRVAESASLRQELRSRRLNIPKRRSLQILQDTNESLERAVNMIRHENNQMQIRINKNNAIGEACIRAADLPPCFPTVAEIEELTQLPQNCTDGDLTDDDM